MLDQQERLPSQGTATVGGGVLGGGGSAGGATGATTPVSAAAAPPVQVAGGLAKGGEGPDAAAVGNRLGDVGLEGFEVLASYLCLTSV
jgi:hypothetical protein